MRVSPPMRRNAFLIPVPSPQRNGRRVAPAARWVQFTISPPVGFGEGGPRADRLHHGGSSEGGRCCLRATAFGSFTNETVAPDNHRAIHFGDNLWSRRIRRWRTHPARVCTARRDDLRSRFRRACAAP